MTKQEKTTLKTSHSKLKLFFAPNSPFARKCRIVVIEKGLQDGVELVESQPPHESAALLAANPLARIPALVLANGDVLCESPVICEYLDSLSEENPLVPRDRKSRIDVLAVSALGSGIMDSAVAIVLEKRRPQDKQYDLWIKRNEEAISRTITMLAKLNLDKNSEWNIGTINVAVALAYVSFRMSHLEWRDEHKKLAQWLDFVNQKPSMIATVPVAG